MAQDMLTTINTQQYTLVTCTYPLYVLCYTP